MKKIFLLATTAVFMTTASAMAASDVTVDEELGVKAELTPLAALTKESDLNFGGLVFDPSNLGTADGNGYVNLVAFDADEEKPSYSSSPAVKAHYGTPSRGHYTYTGSLNLNGGMFTIGGQSCTLNGVYCDTDEIALGENAKLSWVGVKCTASPNKECYFGGELRLKKTYLESLESTATLSQSLTITYNY